MQYHSTRYQEIVLSTAAFFAIVSFQIWKTIYKIVHLSSYYIPIFNYTAQLH